MAIAPQPPATVNTSPHSVDYTVIEDGNAAATYQLDVLAALTAAGYTAANSPLFAALDDAFANQAAARTAFWGNCDLIISNTNSAAPVTFGIALLVDPNVSGALAGNFRLDLTAAKAAAANTGTWNMRVAFRHSIPR